MPIRDLLIEIGTEELPPKALRPLAGALEKLITGALENESLVFDSITQFATPRRLAVLITGLPESQEDKEIFRLGPALSAAYDDKGNPTPAASGFAKSCGVDIKDLSTSKNSGVDKLAFTLTKKGQKTIGLIPSIIKNALNQLPAPKKMRWGSSREEFVRPIQWMIVLFGEEVITTNIYGVKSDRKTLGHRFHCNKEISIDKARDYEITLEKIGHVVPCFKKRREIIRSLVLEEGKNNKAVAIIEDDLLDEVTGLVEYPVALIGDFDDTFLSVPPEALILAMKSHQKCFYLVNNTGELLPKFITVSNIISKDPEQVIEGNERVIRPRLADARFFFDADRSRTLASRLEPLKKVTFQDKLGSVYDKSIRVSVVAKSMAGKLGVDAEYCEKAAKLSKCDLLTNMVGEFPDLQGVIGSYYARYDGEPEEVCKALQEHYLPKFSGDKLPETISGSILAISDKLDSTVGLFGIGQPPTGSKDPFALRRSAIGILRILVEKKLDLNVLELIREVIAAYAETPISDDTEDKVFDFLLERFRSWYLDDGITSEVFQSVLAVKPERPLDFHNRIQAVNNFSKLPESINLAAANKRVSNLLNKNESNLTNKNCDEDVLVAKSEKLLFTAIKDKVLEVAPYYKKGEYDNAFQSLATLKNVVDEFFDDVLVMDDNLDLRHNRLCLLQELRGLFLQAADISHLHTN
ncbi:MAG: glycine--tRNA ligase subunit beta [Gammaproteobacteria bacterium]|nr:glycine--tRNA ligase subunit beta [Gammaproteobacteria bacterium]